MTRPDVLIVTGEPSGDDLARGLAAALHAEGARVATATGAPVDHSEHVVVPRPASVMGLWDAMGAVGRLRRGVSALRAWVGRRRPRVLVTIDAPSFTLRVSRALRPLPSLHVVAPQVWAWRPGRLRRLAGATDGLLCLLPFEPRWFSGYLRAVYVGHPATAIRPDPVGPRPAFALLAGSRPAEVRRLAPVLQSVAEGIRARWPEAALLTARAPAAPPLHVPGLVEVAGVAQLAGVQGAVAASGTVTLQLQALGIPQVVVAATDPLSWRVGQAAVRTPWVALPNVLAGAAVVAEHVQQLDPERIVHDLGHARPLPPPGLHGSEAFERMAHEVLGRVAAAS